MCPNIEVYAQKELCLLTVCPKGTCLLTGCLKGNFKQYAFWLDALKGIFSNMPYDWMPRREMPFDRMPIYCTANPSRVKQEQLRSLCLKQRLTKKLGMYIVGDLPSSFVRACPNPLWGKMPDLQKQKIENRSIFLASWMYLMVLIDNS